MAILSMTWPQFLGSLAIGCVVWQIVRTYTRYKRLSHIPGPMAAALTPFWLAYHSLRGELYLAMKKNIDIYGSPLRIAPNIIVFDDPGVIRLVNTPKEPFVRGQWFKAMKFDPRTDNLLSVTDEEQHARMRRNMIPGYSGSEVPSLEADVDIHIIELLDLMRNYAQEGHPFDLTYLTHYLALDVLTSIAFGEPLGFLTQNKDLFDYIATSKAFYPIMELQNHYPLINQFLQSPIMAGAQPKPTDKRGLGKILGAVQKAVADRLEHGEGAKADILSSFIRHGLNQVELESETILVILAGTESTATALRTTLYYVVTNALVYNKLVKEITSTKATRPVITNSEAQALPYLRAVMLEGMRIFVPLHGIGTKNPPKGGAFVEGVFVPEGTEFGMALYSMLHRKDIFGEDADMFRPERWIDNEESDIKAMERVAELVFGAGRSSCLGKNIALMEFRKALFEILYAFDIVLVDVMKPMTTRVHSIAAQEDFNVRAYLRSSN